MVRFLIFSSIFLFISCSQIGHRKSFDRGPASTQKLNCVEAMKDLLALRTPEKTAKRSLEKIKEKLEVLPKLQGDSYFQTLKEVEDQLDRFKSFVIRYGDDKDGQELLGYYTELNKLRANPQFQKGDFSFRRLWSFFQNINPEKRVERLNLAVREDFLTQKKIQYLKSQSVTGQDQKRVLEQIEEIAFLREVHPPAIIGNPIDWKLFKAWVITRKSEIPQGQYQNVGELYDDFFEQFKNATSSLKKAQKSEILEKAQQIQFETYNRLQNIQVKQFENHEDFITKAHLMISSYGSLDPNFRTQSFFEHLSYNRILNEDFYAKQVSKQTENNELITLGSILNNKYAGFAPYAVDNKKNVDLSLPKKLRNKVKETIGKTKNDFKNCDSLQCYLNSIRTHYLGMTKAHFYKRNFNCLASNPFIIKSMVMDVSIIVGSLVVYYYTDDDMERFPWEMVANTFLFTPIMGEANCRASFKSPLNFGEALAKEEVFASRALKAKRFGAKLKDLSIKGGIATLGLLGFTYGFDQLYMAMGYEIENHQGLTEIAMVLPFMFTYYAVWNNVKGLVFQNPIRHKLIPKIARIFENKTKIKGSYIFTQTGLDLGAFYGLSMYHNWEYLAFYKNTLEPWWRKTIGLDKENSSEIEVEIEESENEIEVTTTHQNGIETKAVLEKTGENTVRLKEVDLDIPTPILEEYVEKSVMPQE